MNCLYCKIKWICRVKDEFEKALKDSRHCIENGSYPNICTDVFKSLAKYCTLYEEIDEEE